MRELTESLADIIIRLDELKEKMPYDVSNEVNLNQKYILAVDQVLVELGNKINLIMEDVEEIKQNQRKILEKITEDNLKNKVI